MFLGGPTAKARGTNACRRPAPAGPPAGTLEATSSAIVHRDLTEKFATTMLTTASRGASMTAQWVTFEFGVLHQKANGTTIVFTDCEQENEIT